MVLLKALDGLAGAGGEPLTAWLLAQLLLHLDEPPCGRCNCGVITLCAHCLSVLWRL